MNALGIKRLTPFGTCFFILLLAVQYSLKLTVVDNLNKLRVGWILLIAKQKKGANWLLDIIQLQTIILF
ncbi:hypothetical protein DMA11_11935 [Marinilabiliaceae bacterium JC017]|nr:hypothetical protein DMA11_11935 [Marinilabiliaceae bacterium JC017]